LIDFADGSASFPKALRQWRLALHAKESLTPNARGIRRRQNKYSVPPSISMGHRFQDTARTHFPEATGKCRPTVQKSSHR
jgi:hypothetical protein